MSRSRKFSSEVGIDTTVLGKNVCIEFTRTTSVSPELYGADADGRRGMWITSVDEDVFSNVRVTYEDADNGHEVVRPLEEFADAAERAAIEEVIGTYIESHEHTVPDDDGAEETYRNDTDD
jgi:hypothetical protein